MSSRLNIDISMNTIHTKLMYTQPEIFEIMNGLPL